jgi:hypothetical protein
VRGAAHGVDVHDHIMFNFRQIPMNAPRDGHPSYDWWCNLGFRVFPSLYPIASALMWPPVALSVRSEALTLGFSRHVATASSASVADPLGTTQLASQLWATQLLYVVVISGPAVKHMQVYSYCRRNNAHKLKKLPGGIWDSTLLQPRLHQCAVVSLSRPSPEG